MSSISVKNSPKVISCTIENKSKATEEMLISQAILKAMAESAKAVKSSKKHDFSRVTSLFGGGK